jgi:hypothetical protein
MAVGRDTAYVDIVSNKAPGLGHAPARWVDCSYAGTRADLSTAVLSLMGVARQGKHLGGNKCLNVSYGWSNAICY